MKRTRIHCSIDVLFHAGVLHITRAVGLHRARNQPRNVKRAIRQAGGEVLVGPAGVIALPAV